MAGYMDIANFSNYGGVGAYATPMLAGGASNPTGIYAQNQAAVPPTSALSTPEMGAGYWAGTRDLINPTAGVTGSGGGPKTNGTDPGTGLGMNIGTARLALGGLQTLGSLWQAWESNKLAKEQFKFSKEFAQANMANQIQSYNTTLEDRTRARSFTEGGSDADAQAYIDKNRLRRQA